VPTAASLPALLLLLPGACTPKKRSRCWPLLLLLLPSSAASAAAAALRGLHFAAIKDSECPSWPFSCSFAKLVLPAPAAIGAGDRRHDQHPNLTKTLKADCWQNSHHGQAQHYMGLSG
jgi:hypothetical protein